MNARIKFDQASQKYRLSFRVSPLFYGFIIGREGSALQQLQRETGCRIAVPRRQDKSEQIVITGSTEREVVSAKTRLDIIMDSAVDKLPYTHFISLPLTTDSFQTSFSQFRDDALRECAASRGLEASIFVKPATLHMTVCMLKLLTPEAIQKAAAALKRISRQIYDLLGTTTLLLNMRGLDSMSDDLEQTYVVHIKPVSDEGMVKVNRISRLVIDTFIEEKILSPQEVERQALLGTEEDVKAGTVDPSGVNVKWHCSAIRAKLRETAAPEPVEGKAAPRNARPPRPTPFDATMLMKKFGAMDFGKHRVAGLHLSDRSARDEKGYYKPVTVVGFP